MSRSSHKGRWDKAGPALCTTVKGVSPRGTSRPSSPSSQAGNPAWSSRPRRGRPVAGHALLLRAASLGRGSRDCGAPGRRRACFPEPRSSRGSLLWEARSGPPPAPAGGPQRKCAATEASTGTSNPPPVIVGQPHGRGLSDSVWSLARTLQMQGPGAAASPPGRGGGTHGLRGTGRPPAAFFGPKSSQKHLRRQRASREGTKAHSRGPDSGLQPQQTRRLQAGPRRR